MRIPLSRPDIGKREIEYVTHALKSGQLSLGPKLAEFEQKFAAYAGTRFAGRQIAVLPRFIFAYERLESGKATK